jgi:hypothetical protein
MLKPRNGQTFALGTNGLFKVGMDVECVVENRYYVDAVLHITGIPEFE